jgi:hypothetical protein
MISADAIFSLANTAILAGWVLLIAFPNWKHTQTLVLNGIIVLFALLYSFLILKDIGSFNPSSFSTLANVKALFQNDFTLTAGWVHYLAFDLFVGAYIVRKSQKLNIPRWLYTLTLPFTFMFGPMGYLLFFIIKSFKTGSLQS